MDLDEIFANQRKYNEKIRSTGNKLDREEWTTTYLLGIVSEIDEVLREINWKKHRKESHKEINRENIAYEFSDLTKYILSLWEIWEFTANDLLYYTDLKSRILELQCEQESFKIPDGSPVLICDIDGTLGDWRVLFLDWIKSDYPDITDQASSLLLDEDLSMIYPMYSVLKDSFEASGQYRNIPIYEDAYEILHKLKHEFNAYIIAVTSRPSNIHSRIWMDTWLWIKDHNLPIDELKISSNSRILLANDLKKFHETIMMEDNPGLIIRGANSGIPIFARRHPYNAGISHKNVRFLESFTEINYSEYFPQTYKERKNG